MVDPNAEPTPAELAAWRKIDVANAKTWAGQRLERARRFRDVEVRQHLGNLVVEIELLETELEDVRRAHGCSSACVHRGGPL